MGRNNNISTNVIRVIPIVWVLFLGVLVDGNYITLYEHEYLQGTFLIQIIGI